MAAYSTLTDFELFDLLKLDDEVAYTQIYDRYIFVMLNHAYNKLRNREEARDVVQEVFTMLWSKRQNLSLASNPSGFLYTAVRNLILDKVIHHNVEQKYLAAMIRSGEQNQNGTDHLIREKQLSSFIEKEIANLPPKMREVFELSRNEHLNHKQIAERLNISEQTVSKHVTNALKILRAKLGILIYLIYIIQPLK